MSAVETGASLAHWPQRVPNWISTRPFFPNRLSYLPDAVKRATATACWPFLSLASPATTMRWSDVTATASARDDGALPVPSWARRMPLWPNERSRIPEAVSFMIATCSRPAASVALPTTTARCPRPKATATPSENRSLPTPSCATTLPCDP